MGGGGASGSSGVPSNSSGTAVSYQPTAQPQADLGYQSILGGFAGALGPGFASAFNNAFPSSNASQFGPYAFAGTPGGVSYDAANPFFGGPGSGTITDPNNPFYQQASTSAQEAATISPYLIGGGANLAGLGNTLASPGLINNAFNASANAASRTAAPLSSMAGNLSGLVAAMVTPQAQNAFQDQSLLTALGTNQLVPGVENAYNLGQWSQAPAASLISAIGGAAPSVTSGALAGSNALDQYGNQILSTAFDPQGALYNQLQNQVSQQSEAAAAAAGLGGSAYGASTVGNNLGNFNINWQNQQLARQAQGLGAAAPAFSTAATLPGSAASSLASALGTTSQAALSPEQTESSLLSSLGNTLQGAAALPANIESGIAQLGGQAGALGTTAAGLPYLPYSGASTAGADIASLLGGGGSLGASGASLAGGPYNLQSTDLSNALAALGSWTNLGNQQFTIPQQLGNDLQSYLQLGQAASGLSGQLGALGLQEQQNSLAGIGSALGTGSNLLFGTQGLGGALGLGSGGLLGGLGGGTSAATASSLADIGAIGGAGGGAIDSGVLAAAPAASSGGFSLASLLPFGAS